MRNARKRGLQSREPHLLLLLAAGELPLLLDGGPAPLRILPLPLDLAVISSFSSRTRLTKSMP